MGSPVLALKDFLKASDVESGIKPIETMTGASSLAKVGILGSLPRRDLADQMPVRLLDPPQCLQGSPAATHA